MSRALSSPRFAVLLGLILCAGLLSADTATISYSPTALTLNAQALSSTPTSATLSIVATGNANWYLVPNGAQPNWLTISPTNGTGNGTVTITVNPSTLPGGVYTQSLQLWVNGVQYAQIPITVNSSSLSATPPSITFNYQTGGQLPQQIVSLPSTVAGTFTATPTTANGGAWLQVSPTSGSLPGALSVTLNSSIVSTLAAGTYNGSITVTPAGLATNVPITIPVTLTVGATPTLTISATALNFNYQLGGTNNQTQQNLQLTSSSGSITFGVTPTTPANPSGRPWLVATPVSGVVASTGPTTVSVGLDTAAVSSLPAGTYSAQLNITGFNATNQTTNIPVTLTVSTLPLLNLSTSGLTFTYQTGAAVPAAQSVTTSSTSTALNYVVMAQTASGGSWLSIQPSSGTTPAAFSVGLNSTVISTLPAGTYNGTVTVQGFGAGNSSVQLPVTLKVSNDPLLTTSSNSLSFAYQTGQAIPAAQNLQIGSTTGATLNYTATSATSSGAAWLALNGNTSASTPNSFTVSVNPANMSPGSNDGTITLTATNPATGLAAPNSPVTVPVKFYISNSALLQPSTTSLTFSASQGGTATPQNIQLLSTSAAEPLNYTVAFTPSSGGNWLLLNTSTGQTPSLISAQAQATFLSAGSYNGNLTITATNPNGNAVANSPLVVPVSLQVTSGTLTVTPASITNLTAVQAGAKATATLSVSGSSALPFTAAASSGSAAVSWLSVTPNSGTTGATPTTLTITADPTGLSAGTYQGTVTIVAPNASGSPAQIPVTFTVTTASITATPASLTFSQNTGAAAPPAQTISLTATGGSVPFTVTANSNGNWLAVTPSSGTASSTATTLSVSVAAGTLAVGSYQGNIQVTAPGAAGSPMNIPVTLTVGQSQTLTVSQTTASFTYQVGGTAPAAVNVQVTSTPANIPVTATAQADAGGTWLSVSPASGTTPVSLAITANTANLAAGTYTGTVTVASTGASNSPQSIKVTLTVSSIPVVVNSVVNAASNIPGAVAPGEIISIYGTNLGPTTVTSGTVTGGVVDTKVGDVQVLFDGVAAPILFVSATQVNCIVPYQVSGRTSTQISVNYKGATSTTITQAVVSAAPGLFTLNQSGTGPGIIQNTPSYAVNLPTVPAAKGSVIVLYATGEGSTFPAGVNGKLGTTDPNQLPKPILPVTATIGGVNARVLYAGGAPGIVAGAIQVNIEVPADAPSGQQVPIVLTVGTVNSQSGVTVSVQ